GWCTWPSTAAPHGDPLTGTYGAPLRGRGGDCQNRPVLRIGVVALGVGDVRRAAEVWGRALGDGLREGGFGGGAAAPVPPSRCSAAGRRPRSPRACTSTCTWPTPPSRPPRRTAWCRWAPYESTGTATPTTRTSSCWRTPTATASASSTSA